jgi:DNA-binding response OmpR family regulator
MAEAFRSGCADYLRSPWSLDEVEARASRFLLLRFSVCDTELIFSGRSIATERESVALTENEYRILRILVLSLNRPVPREAFALALWGEVRPRSRAVDVQISVLRGKLQGLLPAGECPLTFSRGRGYRLEGKCCG